MPEFAFAIAINGELEMVPAHLTEGLFPGDFQALEGDQLEDAVACFMHDDYPVISPKVKVQAAYIRMRRKGESHNMAEILAIRKFPALNTDTEFNKGRCCGNQFEHIPQEGDWYKREAEKHGVSTTGKFYCKGIARFPGDPKAWISDRGDVLRVAKENGMKVSGAVNYTPPQRDPTPDVKLADDILDREVDEYMALGGGEKRADVTEKMRALLTGEVDPHAPLVQD